jgi:DNA mismatch repair protein MutL
LAPEEARKIAAGEVIDRPAALVREFIDNALDSGGDLIEVFIEEGGLRRVEVVDNGCGMTKEDLELCVFDHATSKIRSLDDLRSAQTLGFRGEALAAAASVSQLQILTSTDGREAWKLEAGPGDAARQAEQSRRSRGTSVRSIGLFDTIPARKRFLKREGSEAANCKTVFNDKALAFPEKSFRFTQDGKLKSFLPPSSLKERFAAIVLNNDGAQFLHEISARGPAAGFTVTIIVGGPELYRNDRRSQYVFANGRRIQDYSLQQALEYGVQGLFPNGVHPAGALFVDINPSLADFNIHPAKREVRFADPGAIHHAVTETLRNWTRNFAGVHSGARYAREPPPYSPALALEALLSNPPEFAPLPGTGTHIEESPSAGDAADCAAEQPPAYLIKTSQTEIPPPASGKVQFIGRVFDLFIIAQKGERLFIIDQHAAHERILYDRFLAGPIPAQELLVASPFTAESDEDDRFLQIKKDELAKLGIVIKNEDGQWRIEALPSDWRLSDSQTVKEILNLKNARVNMAEHWAATLSCHGAIRDGDYLDDGSALTLAAAVLELSEPRCPHGRPLWFEISRDDLYHTVRRTL